MFLFGLFGISTHIVFARIRIHCVGNLRKSCFLFQAYPWLLLDSEKQNTTNIFSAVNIYAIYAHSFELYSLSTIYTPVPDDGMDDW